MLHLFMSMCLSMSISPNVYFVSYPHMYVTYHSICIDPLFTCTSPITFTFTFHILATISTMVLFSYYFLHLGA